MSTGSTHSLCKLRQLGPIPSASTFSDLSRFVTPMLSPLLGYLGWVNNTIPRSINRVPLWRQDKHKLVAFQVSICTSAWSHTAVLDEVDQRISGIDKIWHDLTSTQVSWPTSSFAQRLASPLSNRLWDCRIPHSLQVDLKWTLRAEARECQHAVRHAEATCIDLGSIH